MKAAKTNWKGRECGIDDSRGGERVQRNLQKLIGLCWGFYNVSMGLHVRPLEHGKNGDREKIR